MESRARSYIAKCLAPLEGNHAGYLGDYIVCLDRTRRWRIGTQREQGLWDLQAGGVGGISFIQGQGLVVGDMASSARLLGRDGLCSEEHGRVAKGEVVDWDKWWNLGVEEEDLLQDCGSRGGARFEAGALRRRTCWL